MVHAKVSATGEPIRHSRRIYGCSPRDSRATRWAGLVVIPVPRPPGLDYGHPIGRQTVAGFSSAAYGGVAVVESLIVLVCPASAVAEERPRPSWMTAILGLHSTRAVQAEPSHVYGIAHVALCNYGPKPKLAPLCECLLAVCCSSSTRPRCSSLLRRCAGPTWPPHRPLMSRVISSLAVAREGVKNLVGSLVRTKALG